MCAITYYTCSGRNRSRSDFLSVNKNKLFRSIVCYCIWVNNFLFYRTYTFCNNPFFFHLCKTFFKLITIEHSKVLFIMTSNTPNSYLPCKTVFKLLRKILIIMQFTFFLLHLEWYYPYDGIFEIKECTFDQRSQFSWKPSKTVHVLFLVGNDLFLKPLSHLSHM